MTATYVTIRFTSKAHIGAKIAALLAQSENFNHCMLIDEGMVYEAVTKGTRYVRPERAMHKVKAYQEIKILVPNIEAMREFLKDQLGASYDWAGAIGLPILRSDNWQDPNKWWCSELIVAALSAGGINILDPMQFNRVTPNDIYILNYEKGPLIRLLH
jgi:hypothetical protein